MGNWENQQSPFHHYWISSCTENHQKSHHILGAVAFMQAPLKFPSLMTHDRNLKLQWARKSRTWDMSCVLFNDKTRETLDRHDRWANGSAYFRDERHQCLHQRQGGGVMLWAGIIGGRLVGPIRVLKCLVIYCNLLKEVLDPCLDDILLTLLRILVLMHVSFHSVSATQAFLGYYSIQGERLMVWLPSLVHH